MGLPGWALVALIGFPLAQIPLVLFLSRWFELDGEAPAPTPGRFLSRWFELDGEAPAPTPGRSYWTEDVGSSRQATRASQAGVCGRCGALNDPIYTFCADCVTRL